MTDAPQMPADIQELAFRLNADCDPLVIELWRQGGYSVEEIREALVVALESSTRSLRYAKAVLERRHKEVTDGFIRGRGKGDSEQLPGGVQ